MECQRVFYRSSVNVFGFMLKGESMDCIYIGSCSTFRPVRSRYRPAKSAVLATPTDKRYFKLHNGDILDTESKTILNWEALRSLLDD